MVREIKFRGLRVDGKGWVYGTGVFKLGVNYVAIPDTKDYMRLIKVTPETVGQFTGKITKSGKLIYEGDKLQQSIDCYWVVKWSNSKCGWNCYQYVFSQDDDLQYSWKKSDTYPLGHSLNGLLTYNYEVIGNIYEGKETNQNGI